MIGGRYGEKKFCVVVTGNENFSHIGGMIQTMKRKGFTLVELLIVIVVIGILSAMMMLSSTEATTSARVSNIISNLRNIKTAALAYYTDNLDTFTADPAKELKDPEKKAILEYLSGNKDGTTLTDIENYKVTRSATDGHSWWVVYQITGSDAEKTAIKKKLTGRTKSLGLKGIEKLDGVLQNAPDYDSHACVALKIR